MLPVVISGGSGTRLWPISRSSLPKQFCQLLEESLFEKTIRRLLPFGKPWTITTAELMPLTSQVYQSLALPTEQILAEPFGRNTAPAIALICEVLERQGFGEEVIGLFPADHLIQNEEAFAAAIEVASKAAAKGSIATLGIQPSSPATGFGYIEIESNSAVSIGSSKAHSVVGFREKPTIERAREFVKQGNFVWNAGIFVFKVRVMRAHLQKFLPQISAKVATLSSDLKNLREVYQDIEPISIDFGVMEKVVDQVCVPCEIGWSDLGSWDDVADHFTNQALPQSAEIVSVESERNFVYSSDQKLIALVGVEDLIVVDSGDATLIVKQGQAQRVREVVESLKRNQHPKLRDHLNEVRPWGRFQTLFNDASCKSKRISINPGAQISYQSHLQRSEHWVIIKGRAEITLNDQVRVATSGEYIFIPKSTKHRIKNLSSEPLEFIEIQTGDYFGEDDIVRYQDDYNRILEPNGSN